MLQPSHPASTRPAMSIAGAGCLLARLALVGAALSGLAACSVSGFAIDRVGDALASGGTTVASGDDPEFVAQAVPFSLTLMESLVAQRPGHRGLLQALAAGFTQYGYAFLQLPADELATVDLARAEALRQRARRMYLRARNYGLQGLEVAQPGFRGHLERAPAQAAQRAEAPDVALLFWTAASWAAAIGMGKDDPALVGDLPKVQALIDRAFMLDAGFDAGAIHSFLIGFTMVRPDAQSPRLELAREHYARAVELSERAAAGPHVAWAEGVCLGLGDRACFEAALASALAVDPDAVPERRLANLVMHRRARWLEQQADRLILPDLLADPTPEGVQP